MEVTETLITSEDLMKLNDGRYELEEGVIRKMAPAEEEHGIITARIIHRIAGFVEENKLGVTTTSETGYKLSSHPDTVKAPDAAYKSNERLAKGGRSKGYSTVMPDLVVEVNSPYDTYTEVFKKVLTWLGAGVLQVWVVDYESRTIIIYYTDGRSRILHTDDELDGGDILPGFKCKVREIFE